MRDVLRILLSPVVWLASFSTVYALHGLVCELDPGVSGIGVSWIRIVLVAAFLFAGAFQIVLLALLYSPRFGSAPGFARSVSRAGGWVGLVATVWTLFPTLATSACSG
ncbi:MAG: hypothetical protein ABJN75_00815 [Hoeflea sp.]|uniref:hypothetical protein n=1 Tax=Hoeflea sp. TaxID=1940281 RepID=UPI0032973BF2